MISFYGIIAVWRNAVVFQLSNLCLSEQKIPLTDGSVWQACRVCPPNACIFRILKMAQYAQIRWKISLFSMRCAESNERSSTHIPYTTRQNLQKLVYVRHKLLKIQFPRTLRVRPLRKFADTMELEFTVAYDMIMMRQPQKDRFQNQ